STTTPAFTTPEGGEELLPFVAADRAVRKRQSAKVAHAGLTGSLVQRANSQSGDAHLWNWATTAPPMGATPTATTPPERYAPSPRVMAVQMSSGVGAGAGGGAPSGPPQVSLKTTEAGSLVFGVGSDWSSAVAPTLGPIQVMLSQALDGAGKPFWSQFTGQIT